MASETPIELLDPREKRTYYFEMTTTRRILTPLVQFLASLLASWHASGVENLPLGGPVVLASNHVTNYDVFFMQFVLPRPIFFMGKEELFQNPLLDAVLRRLGGFPVKRGAKDNWALEQAMRVLEHNQVMGIFPEGKRNRGLGLNFAKTGAARLAMAACCPLVPMAVYGTHRLFHGLPRTPVTLALGKPIYPDRFESPLALTDHLMFTLAELLPPEQRGVYSHPVIG
jgi:1-acyl-sn-glycerol-3-phosphate acyltransferase